VHSRQFLRASSWLAFDESTETWRTAPASVSPQLKINRAPRDRPDRSPPMSNVNWMSKIQHDPQLIHMVLPASHDAGV